jgi:Protein of unknown function (DUF2750)
MSDLHRGNRRGTQEAESADMPGGVRPVRRVLFRRKRCCLTRANRDVRAPKVIENVQAYAGMRVVEISLNGLGDKWLQDLKRDGLHVGLNWSGSRAVGYELTVDYVIQNLAVRRRHQGDV